MSSEDDPIAAMIARVEAEARRKVSNAAAGGGFARWVKAPPGAAVVTSPTRLRSASPVQPSPSPGLSAGVVQVLQAEKDSAFMQLAHAKQALTVERTLVEAKNQEFKGVLDALNNQLTREKDGQVRAAAEREGEMDMLRRRCAELENEVTTLQSHFSAADSQLQHKGVEATQLAKQLGDVTVDREREAAQLSLAGAEVVSLREKLAQQSCEGSVLIGSLRTEVAELSVANEELVKELRLKAADGERMANDVRLLKLQAMESGQNGDAIVRRASDAEALAAKRAEQLAASEGQVMHAEHELRDMHMQLTGATMKLGAAEKRCAQLEEEQQKMRLTLGESDAASERNRSSQTTVIATLKAGIADLEARCATSESELERIRSSSAMQQSDAQSMKHVLEAELEDYKRRAVHAEADVLRARGEITAYEAAAKATQQALEERVEREKSRAQQAQHEGDVLREQISQLRIAEQQGAAELARERASKDAAVELAGSGSRELRDTIRSLQEELAAKHECLRGLDQELAAARRREVELGHVQRRLDERGGEADAMEAKLKAHVAALEAAAAEQASRMASVEGELSAAKRNLAEQAAQCEGARLQNDATAQALEATRRELEDASQLLGKAQGSELHCEEQRKRVAYLAAELDRKTQESDRLRSDLTAERGDRVAARNEEEALRRQVSDLVEKVTAGDDELAKLMGERDVAYQRNIDTNGTLARATADKEALEREVDALQKALDLARASAEKDDEAHASVLQKRVAALTEELDCIAAARSEMVRSTCTLLTELGIVRQGFSSMLTNQTLRKALARNKPILDELHRSLDRLSRARQQAKLAVSSFLTDVEKMHYGASDWREVSATSPTATRRPSGSTRSRSAASQVRDLREARTIKTRMLNLEHLQHQAPTTPRAGNAGNPGVGQATSVSPTRSRTPMGGAAPNLSTLRSFAVSGTFGSPKRSFSPRIPMAQ